jgi:hypothetical protein
MKKGLALTAALAIAATTLAATAADAQNRKSKRYYGDSYQYGRNADNWQQSNQVHGRRDSSSYDGYRTGQPRTCGSDFFRYDDRGVPMGPYCN